MRVILALFFIATFPIVTFIASILYGGVTPQILKDGLTKAQIYDRLPEQIANSLKDPENSEDDNTATFFSVIQNKFSGTYLQSKTENLIDNVDLWVKDKSDIPPSLSFPEIKEELTLNNPELLATLTEGLEEMKKQAVQDQSQNDSLEQGNAMQEFIDNDFSMSLEESLKPLKDGYNNLTIAFPVIIILSLLSIGGIVLLSHGTFSKLKWTGIVLIIASINGFVWAISASIFASLLTQILLSQDNQIIRLISPVILNITSTFVTQLKSYQSITSILSIALGIILLILTFAIPKNQVIVKKATSTKR